MAKVFVSYKTESALELVRDKVVPALEKAGHTCWYAYRNSGPGLYAGNIKRAIGECRVFLLILDRAALHAAHIKSEVSLAFRRLNESEDIIMIPFRVDECSLREDDDLDYFLNSLQIIDGNPPDTAHIRNLVDKISLAL